MLTTIDKGGRVVIPAEIRARAGLKPGMEVDVRFEDFSIRILRAVPGPVIETRGRRRVARPQVRAEDRTPIDIPALIEQERDRWPR